jgi:hypothetical protein
MKTMFKKLLHTISLSVLSDNTHSSARIQAYIILLPVLLMSLMFIVIEVTRIVYCFMHDGVKYEISSEIIIIYGMLLSHHLALLFSRRSNNDKNSNTNIIKQ